MPSMRIPSPVLALFTVAMTLLLPGCALDQALLHPQQKSTDTAAMGPPTPASADQSASALQIETPPAPAKPMGPPQPPQDLWQRIRLGMQLKDSGGEREVQQQAEWYAHHRTYIDRVSERAKPYLYLIVQQVQARGMPTEIALLPIVESAFQPFAYSHGRAAGLWQFVPGTGRRFSLRQDWWYDGRRDVVQSTRAALDYLQYLHDEFNNSWLLALAAYNSGEGTVDWAIRYNRRHHRPTDFWHLKLPQETRGYVPRLLAIAKVVAHPKRYGISLAPIPNRPLVAQVNVGSQIDLALAARLAGLSIEQLYRYNPGYNRWATDPNGPHKLLLPVTKVAMFEKGLQQYPPSRRIHWVRHRVRPGEAISVIAARYHTTTHLIRRVNHLRSDRIVAGRTLIIPVARTQLDEYALSANQRRKDIQDRHHPGRRIVYVVHKGDTFWDISRKYHVAVAKLAKWNGMAPADPLHPGRKLVIWAHHHATRTASARGSKAFIPVSFVHPERSQTRRRIGYTVHSGDSLALISQRFRVSIKDLCRWNGLKRSGYLHPGQNLTLYVDVTRQSGNI